MGLDRVEFRFHGVLWPLGIPGASDTRPSASKTYRVTYSLSKQPCMQGFIQQHPSYSESTAAIAREADTGASPYQLVKRPVYDKGLVCMCNPTNSCYALFCLVRQLRHLDAKRGRYGRWHDSVSSSRHCCSCWRQGLRLRFRITKSCGRLLLLLFMSVIRIILIILTMNVLITVI